jgi:hypothetical protein
MRTGLLHCRITNCLKRIISRCKSLFPKPIRIPYALKFCLLSLCEVQRNWFIKLVRNWRMPDCSGRNGSFSLLATFGMNNKMVLLTLSTLRSIATSIPLVIDGTRGIMKSSIPTSLQVRFVKIFARSPPIDGALEEKGPHLRKKPRRMS